MDYSVLHRSSSSFARVSSILTQHGSILTPAFVPVCTTGSPKCVPMSAVDDFDLVFSNTYHLLVHPGANTVAELGGIHSFTSRSKPFITDSGGFQVFSLKYTGGRDELKGRTNKPKQKNMVSKIDEDGVHFRSYRDGRQLFLSPEASISAQHQIGADLIVAFDELPPYGLTQKRLQRSFDRTHRWMKRSLDFHNSSAHTSTQRLYGIVHGETNMGLRLESLRFLLQHNFPGIAIGGSVGQTRKEMYSLICGMRSLLPSDRPVHLLGIGDLQSIVPLIQCGVDSLDSTYPTKAGRHGTALLTPSVDWLISHSLENSLVSATLDEPAAGRLNELHLVLSKAEHQQSAEPIDETCTCPVCLRYSRGYLHHLLKMHESAGQSLVTLHNLHIMRNTMETIRHLIRDNKL
ncbi:mitochondrial queuine tRNA-ribosyltransferase (TGT) [Andalucia godoyi]|uniref:Mitochondrial queuine tRNA-ribosyltransferase (TGT) n=1 Tax=Andalucia godoyi TaxID=505711 RepID=A0A8K0F492_ANDGO|nr:mitochondrial queuine tRNA-ribosyltransferase (TGT) [Andalucia godoyi]|eukprot:ANDGO_05629.mRNA.1 mitochondrial queuine tRNA-ribosyltransferase (TGT)